MHFGIQCVFNLESRNRLNLIRRDCRYTVKDFWHPNDEGGMAWNDSEIGILRPHVKGI